MRVSLKFYFYFCNIINIKEEKLDEYKEKLKELQVNFKYNFEDLKSLKCTFICDIIEDGFPISEVILSEKAARDLELLEMKGDQALQMLYKASSMIEFRKLVPESKYPNKKAACRLFSIFGTTYCCESLYATMKFFNSKHRSQLTNQHLTEFMRTALTNFTANFKNLTIDFSIVIVFVR